MDKPARVPRERERKLRMALELSQESVSWPAFEDVLARVVEAAGAVAGLMTTWDPGHREKARTTSYGLDPEASRQLSEMLERAAPQLNAESIGKLEEATRLAGERIGMDPLFALALPMRSHDQLTGVLCLLFTSDTPSLLKDAPGVYNLLIDHVEMMVESARLLARLLQERRWLEAVVHHNSDGVIILDREGMVMGFNVAMEHLSGWTLADAVGRPGSEIFPFERVEGPGTHVPTRPAGATPAYPTEARLRTRDGRQVDVEVTSSPMQDDKQQALGWVMTVRDISMRKEMERLQRIFLSAMSHELQTPIAIIKGYAGLMADPAVDLTAEQARDRAKVIHEESERLERMVKQMLDATRIQAGGIQLQREPVDVGKLLRRTVQKMETLAKGASVHLTLQGPRQLPTVLGDADRLQQVVTNLIENALKYSAGSDIRVTAVPLPQEQHLVVSVEDSGPGIAEHDRERIFRLFERGAMPTGKSIRGAGLGLFICKSIVEAHGGRIGVDRSPSGGARFFFMLPIVSEE
ncbi:MAG: sensor histidine kinase [Candidatus Xenobia bacterium]